MIDKTDPTNRDTVPAMLTPGEFVVNKEATEMYGPLIEQMNNNGLQQRFAENKAMEANMGGCVKYYNDGIPSATNPVDMTEEYIQNLLNTISRGEGATPEKLAAQEGFGTTPYDMVLGYGTFGKPSKPLSKMTMREVYDYQKELIKNTKKAKADGTYQYDPSSAVGKYQTINLYLFGEGGTPDNPTEKSWMSKAGLNADSVYDAKNQEKVGRIVLNESGFNNFKTTKDMDQFQRMLSKKWASVANPDTEVGSYGQRVDTFREDLQPHFNNLAGVPSNISAPVVNELAPSTSIIPQSRPKTILENPKPISKELQPIVMEQPPASLPTPSSFNSLQNKAEVIQNNNNTTVPSMEQAPPMMQEFISPLPNAGADASFGSAFKEARGQMGAGQVFDYGGKQYTTNFAEEEDMMTANMGGKACSCGKKKVCDCGLGMTYANMGGDIPIQNLNMGDWVKSMANSIYSLIPQKNFEGYGTEVLPRWKQELQDRELDPRLSGEQGSQMYPNSVPKIEDVLPPVDSDQSLLDGSSQSVKDSQRMMMFNNPIPNALPVPNGNPIPPTAPSVDFPPMQESFESVPQSVQDSKRMIDINADNGFIPKPNIDVPVEQVSTEAEAAAERISEEISDLRLRMAVMESGSPMRAILQTQVDQKLGQIASMGQSLNPATLPKPKQTGVNTNLINAKTKVEAANLELRKAKTAEEIQTAANNIAAAELEVENSATIPEIQTSMITKANTESLESRRNLLSSINTQINNSNNPRVIAALNEKKKVIQADIKDYNTSLMLEEGGVNVLGERGRRSPYLQYGDMVQSRIDALEKSTEPEGSPPNNTNNTTTTTQTDSESIESLGNQIAKETKNTSQVTEAKGLLSSVFGDLFDSKELMRAAIMYLGGRATGMTGNQALAFAGKTYLAREEANDTAMKKHINKLITDGDYTTASIKLYKETGDIDVLQPKGATYVDLGETKTYYPISGKMKGVAVQARKVKGSDGSIKWQGQNGQFLSLNKYHTDINRSKSRPRSAINAEVAQVEKLFTSLRDDYGTVKTAQGGESAVYRTRLNPRLVGEKTVDWAMSNNIPPYAVGEVLEGAYKRALADAARENKPLIAESIDGYLHSQWIQMSAGDVTDFMTGDEKNPKPIETTAVNEWVGGIKSKVSAVNPKEFEGMNDIVFSTFLRESKLTDSYRNTEANGGISLKDRQTYIRRANAQTPPISGYMLYMQENVAKEYRLLLDKRSQVTS